jgi:Copper chaperone
MKKILLKINGMHCASCSLNIDLDLEETKGVINSKTNYVKAIAEITYDPKLIDLQKIKKIVNETGYGANEV